MMLSLTRLRLSSVPPTLRQMGQPTNNQTPRLNSSKSQDDVKPVMDHVRNELDGRRRAKWNSIKKGFRKLQLHNIYIILVVVVLFV